MTAVYTSSPIVAKSWNEGIPSIGRLASRKKQRARGLHNISTMDTYFKSKWALYFTAFIACAFCGVVHLGPPQNNHHGGNHDQFSTVFPADTGVLTPPALLQSPHLGRHVSNSAGKWYSCQNCASTTCGRSEFQISYNIPGYLNKLFHTPVFALQQLSVIDLGSLFAEQLRGYAQGTMRRMSYISAAIVTFDSTDLYALTEEHTGNLVSIIASNIQTNPIVRQFQTMFERFGDDFTRLTVIPSRVIADMLRDQVDRSPIVNTGDPSSYRFASLQPADITLSQLQNHERIFTLGTQYVRNELEERVFTVDSVGMATIDNGDDDSAEISSTFEYAMFPFLFPMGAGFYTRRGRNQFSNYLRYRMMCLFSIFTLHPQYLLLMHQLHTAHRIMSKVSETVKGTAFT